ncbi:Uncharacterized protein SCG7109_AS_00100 [Chlamydiales bacterium SCGC AG-110-M15]|nr:Uncharacterized protein SCG7109_AS_00100 [Chlamydiales bacterium SCGC AG-110-M15]
MKWKSMLINPVLALLMGSALTSCGSMVFIGGAAAGAGLYKYVRGEMLSVERATVEETYHATVKALEGLRITIDDGEYDSFAGFVTAQRVDGARIEVRLKSRQTDLTEITVRIGIFGDEEDSKRLLDAIHKEIG